jgi:uncharacterized Ntn-hydrolase superfamily protein
MGGSKIVATFSIVAADPQAGEVGVAVASRFLAVGAIVPWASAGAGAVATQAYANPSFGPRGLAMMRDGLSAADALGRLLAEDPDSSRRQIGLVDMSGRSAAHTGPRCQAWAGHIVGPSFACQGNIITGNETVAAMAASFRSSTGQLADRLCDALAAGERAGGDRRGRQSAALYVAREKAGYLGFNDVLADLRVDDAVDPVGELARLLELQHLFFGSSPPDQKLPIDGALLRELQAMMAGTGHLSGSPSGIWDTETERALEAFVGVENLEERVDLASHCIDEPALSHLRTLYPRQ